MYYVKRGNKEGTEHRAGYEDRGVCGTIGEGIYGRRLELVYRLV